MMTGPLQSSQRQSEEQVPRKTKLMRQVSLPTLMDTCVAPAILAPQVIGLYSPVVGTS